MNEGAIERARAGAGSRLPFENGHGGNIDTTEMGGRDPSRHGYCWRQGVGSPPRCWAQVTASRTTGARSGDHHSLRRGGGGARSQVEKFTPRTPRQSARGAGGDGSALSQEVGGSSRGRASCPGLSECVGALVPTAGHSLGQLLEADGPPFCRGAVGAFPHVGVPRIRLGREERTLVTVTRRPGLPGAQGCPTHSPRRQGLHLRSPQLSLPPCGALPPLPISPGAPQTFFL